MAREQECEEVSLKGPSPVHCVCLMAFKGLMLPKKPNKNNKAGTQTHQEKTRRDETRQSERRKRGGTAREKRMEQFINMAGGCRRSQDCTGLMCSVFTSHYCDVTH